MKNSTVPRLELYEVMCFSIVFKYCVLLSKLIKSDTDALTEELVIDHIYCLNKSQVVLHWIKDIKKEWKLWVNNRFVKICTLTKPEYWRYISSKDNLC